MLTQYKNINEILNAKKGISADRLPDIKNSLTSLRYEASVDSLKLSSDFIKEFHVYSGKSWITGIHELISGQHYLPTNSTINNLDYFTVNTLNLFKDLQLSSGNYTILFNFFNNLIGSYKQQYLVIDEISPDRTEIKLKLISFTNESINQTSKQQLINFANTVKQTVIESNDPDKLYKSYILNFSRNQTFVFVNSVVVNNFLYVKLLDPLPENILLDYKCWIVEEIKPSYIDHVNLLPDVIVKTYIDFSTPNFEAITIQNSNSNTDYKSWSDLLSTSPTTSQQLIDSYFSGSLSGMQLNIDFSDFNNFVFYSSAAERVENFRYKLNLLEQYTAQSASVALVNNTTVATTNALDIQTKIDNLIGGYDSFERYLYNVSSSVKLSTHDIPLEFATVPDITGSYITTAPHVSNTLLSVTSSQFITWYNSLYATASLYDQKNINSLRNMIPLHVRDGNDVENVQLFADMLGQHFDILYTYIKHMSSIHKRDENPRSGMPNELLYSVAKQFGWNLVDGRQTDDLWKYVFGINETGTAVTGSNSILNESVSSKDLTYATWRRIVNNLPLLLKTKGTKRSIHALMSCYGIPKSIISINEYGGPRADGRIPVYERPVSHYALDLINNVSGSLQVNYKQPIQSVELRMKTDDVYSNPLLPTTMTLYTIGSNVVTLEYESGNLGNIQINGTGSGQIELFDGGWISTLLRTVDNKLEIVAKKSKFGKIVSSVSASATASFGNSGTLNIGVNTSGSRLQGQLQELRFWTSSLSNEVFNDHVNAPKAYNGNTDANSELIFRLPLTEKIDHSVISGSLGIQLLKIGSSASFANWSTNTPYDLIEETHYNQSVSLGGSVYDDNKVRVESSTLPDSTLDATVLKSIGEYDDTAIDSKRLGVYFSPQTMIDEDIMNYFGYIDLNDYVGDPGPTEKRSYPKLKKKSYDFWKQYNSRTDINEFIKLFSWFDLSFFQQLEQLLPARAEKITGVLLHPTLLERSKDTVLEDVTAIDSTIDTNAAILRAVELKDIGKSAEIISVDDTLTIKDSVVPVSVFNAVPIQQNKLNLIKNLTSDNIQNNTQLARIINFNTSIDEQTTVISTLTQAIKYKGSDYAYKKSNDPVPDWAFEPILPFIEPSSVVKLFRTSGFNQSRYIGSKLRSNGVNQVNADGVSPVEVNDVSGNQFNV